MCFVFKILESVKGAVERNEQWFQDSKNCGNKKIEEIWVSLEKY